MLSDPPVAISDLTLKLIQLAIGPGVSHKHPRKGNRDRLPSFYILTLSDGQ